MSKGNKPPDPNLFDHGRSSQEAIIKPYIRKIRQRMKGKPLDSDSRAFFMGQLESCIAMLGEHENKPSWVVDVSIYRMKSEISVFLSLFSALELSDDPSDEDREENGAFYNAVRDMGKERGWDLKILHIQFLRAMGNNVQNYITQLVLPRCLHPLDYN